MSPKGWSGPEYQADDAESAIRLAEADGHDIVDVMDDILVTLDEEDNLGSLG